MRYSSRSHSSSILTYGLPPVMSGHWIYKKCLSTDEITPRFRGLTGAGDRLLLRRRCGKGVLDITHQTAQSSSLLADSQGLRLNYNGTLNIHCEIVETSICDYWHDTPQTRVIKNPPPAGHATTPPPTPQALSEPTQTQHPICGESKARRSPE